MSIFMNAVAIIIVSVIVSVLSAIVAGEVVYMIDEERARRNKEKL